VAPIPQGNGAKNFLGEDDSETIASANRRFTPSPATLELEPATSNTRVTHIPGERFHRHDRWKSPSLQREQQLGQRTLSL